jgi:hypothetical protein
MLWCHRNGSILLPTCYVVLRGFQKWLFKLGPKLALTARLIGSFRLKKRLWPPYGGEICGGCVMMRPIEASLRPSATNLRRMDGLQFRVHGYASCAAMVGPLGRVHVARGCEVQKWADALKRNGSTVRHAKRLSWAPTTARPLRNVPIAADDTHNTPWLGVCRVFCCVLLGNQHPQITLARCARTSLR